MKLPAEAHLDQAAALAATVPAELAACTGDFVVDASALKTYDTSTISLLLQARRAAQAAGRGFVVTGLPRQLEQLATLYGVDELLSSSSDGPRPAST